jgi:hypothetical protein
MISLAYLLLENDSDLSTMNWYHGTDADFDVFDRKYFGKTDSGWWGEGEYFHSDRDTASVYGKNIKRVRLRFKNPLVLPTDNSGMFLFNVLKELGANPPEEYKDFSAMNIIREFGKANFTNLVKDTYDGMIINYVQGTKEAVVFDSTIIDVQD